MKSGVRWREVELDGSLRRGGDPGTLLAVRTLLTVTSLVLLASCGGASTDDAGLDASAHDASDDASVYDALTLTDGAHDAALDAPRDLGVDLCTVACTGLPAGCHVTGPAPPCGCPPYACDDAGTDAGDTDASRPDASACVAPTTCATDADCGCAAPCIVTGGIGFCAGV